MVTGKRKPQRKEQNWERLSYLDSIEETNRSIQFFLRTETKQDEAILTSISLCTPRDAIRFPPQSRFSIRTRFNAVRRAVSSAYDVVCVRTLSSPKFDFVAAAITVRRLIITKLKFQISHLESKIYSQFILLLQS